MQKETWVIVANKETARIFEVEKFGKLKEIHTLIHPQSGLKADELYSDNMGTQSEAYRLGQHTMEPVTPLKLKESIIFARQLVKHLEAEKNNGSKFSRIFIMAEPHFLGVIRGELPETLKKYVEGEIPKDLTKFTPNDIWSYMPLVN